MDLPARDSPCPRPPCAGSPAVLCGVSLLCCGVVCVGAVCVQNFRGCVQNWALPKLPSAGPPPDSHLRRTPLRRTAQNFALFSLSRRKIRSFLPSLGVVSLNFGGVIEGRDPQMCTFGLSGCRVKPRRLLQNVKNNFTIDLPPRIRLSKKSMTNCCKFCLRPEKKSLEHNRTCCLCCLCCS